MSCVPGFDGRLFDPPDPVENKNQITLLQCLYTPDELSNHHTWINLL